MSTHRPPGGSLCTWQVFELSADIDLVQAHDRPPRFLHTHASASPPAPTGSPGMSSICSLRGVSFAVAALFSADNSQTYFQRLTTMSRLT